MHLKLRPATTADLPYARALYFETMRWIAERLFGWNEAVQIERFAQQFDPSQVRIVVLDGEQIGWIQVVDREDGVFLGQLYVAPAYQRRGIGSELVRQLIARADERRLPVKLGVVKFNPALALYQRLGFRVTSEDEYKFYMERPPS